MKSLKFRNPEIKVFLKCQLCGTFITSPCIPVIKKHFDKCQHRHINSASVKRPPEEDGDQFDMECDFIDDEIESVTFSQPFVVLNRCNLPFSKVKSEQGHEFESRLETKPPRFSRVKALENVSKVWKSESKHGEAFDSKDDENWGSESEEETVNIKKTLTTEKSTKPVQSKRNLGIYSQNLCRAYNSPFFPFKCTSCTARFATEHRLTWHKQRVHESPNEDIFSCSICGRMFHKRFYYQNHLKCHEGAEDTEKEFNLLQKWPEPPKRIGIKTHIIKFNCKYCLMPHYNHSTFVTHMATHSNKSPYYTCPYTCSTQTTSIKQLITHLKTDHRDHYFGKTVYENGKPKAECDICHKYFDIGYLPAHKALHVTGGVSKKSYDGISCPYPKCNNMFKEVRYFRTHFVLHLQNNPFICIFPGCTLKVDSVSRLKIHMKLHLETPYICSKCGVSYSRTWKLKTHSCQTNVDKLATGNYKLVQVGSYWRLKKLSGAGAEISEENTTNNCDVIGSDGLTDKYTQYIKSLKEVNIKTVIKTDPVFIQTCKDSKGFGELLLGADFDSKFPRKFECSKCSTVFGGMHGYSQHKKHCSGVASSKYKNTSKGTVGCTVCGISFGGSDLLETHFSQEHSNCMRWRCEASDCGLIFLNKKSKQRHFQRHHAQRPFPCSKCDKNFITRRSLNQHLELHQINPRVGVYNASCVICGIELVSLHSLRRHKLLIHGIKVPLTKSTTKTAKITKKIVNKNWRAKEAKVHTNNVRRSGRQRIVKKVFDPSLSKAKIQPEKLKTRAELIQVKIEPELHILPEGMELDNDDGDVNDMYQEFGEIGKYETDESIF